MCTGPVVERVCLRTRERPWKPQPVDSSVTEAGAGQGRPPRGQSLLLNSETSSPLSAVPVFCFPQAFLSL